MIGLVSKYWKLILDILLVIALIVALFLWNPFNLFGKEVKLQHTANVVSQIKQIGQLVTAEYYGEVIASLGEAKLNFLQKDYLNEEADSVYLALKAEVYDAYIYHVIKGTEDIPREKKRERKKKKAREDAVDELLKSYGKNVYTQKINPTPYINDTLDIVLLYVAEMILDERTSLDLKKLEKDRKRKQFRKKQLENLLNEIERQHLTLDEAELDLYLQSPLGNNPSFSSYYYTFFQEKEDKKNQLAMIGRGSVKAGFDFGTFDENNFHMDREAGVIHLFGIKPTILDFDINPWFIPQNAVPGYDIVQEGRMASFDDAKKVKSYCRAKLHRRALEAGIITEAQRYGEDVLKTFLSLVLDTEIRQVVFHENMESAFLRPILEDKIIHHSEIELIKAAEKQYLDKIKSTESKVLKNVYQNQLGHLIYKLSQLPLQLVDSSQVPFNYFTFHLHGLMSDSTLTDTSINTGSYMLIDTSYRWGIDPLTFAPNTFNPHSHWFYDSAQVDTQLFTTHYNDMLTYIRVGENINPSVNLDHLQYICLQTKDSADYMVKNLDSTQMLLAIKKDCPKSLKSRQKSDLDNYTKYLQHRQKAYDDKIWVYKLRDNVSTKVDLQKLKGDITERMSWK